MVLVEWVNPGFLSQHMDALSWDHSDERGATSSKALGTSSFLLLLVRHLLLLAWHLFIVEVSLENDQFWKSSIDCDTAVECANSLANATDKTSKRTRNFITHLPPYIQSINSVAKHASRVFESIGIAPGL